MPVVIDHAALDRALATLKQMAAKDRWLGEVAMRVSAGGLKLVADEYRTSTDPYGKPWAPLAQPRQRDKAAARRAIAKGKTTRGHKVLIDTGRMRTSTGASPSGKLAKIVIPTWYAAIHQNGAFIKPHTRVKSYSNVTYRVGNRFVSEKQARAAHRKGKNVQAGRYTREYRSGITIPQRMILPLSERLPATWDTMIGRETSFFMRQRFGGR